MAESKELQFKQQLNKTTAYLHFEDGTKFKGKVNLEENSALLEKGIWGEAAFTTGMSGYLETMTDPSFLGQHIIFTTAHVGNYSSDSSVMQSKKSHATSLIARNFSYNSFLNETDVPLFVCQDTRALVKFLTSTKASHKSVITKNPETPSAQEFNNAKLVCNDLDRVSQTEDKVIIPGDNPIVLVNYGCKSAIIENLKNLNYPLVTVGHKTTAEEIKKYNPSLIFLSNGPGDPRAYTQEIENVKEYLKLQTPVRGICLGHQLLSLALGAEIIRLPFGQRGVNHPCLDKVSGEIVITSQNHGYATDEDSLLAIAKSNSLDRELFVSYRSLFDQSVEGMATTDHFLKSVQFHPEAFPGPKDAAPFFTEIKEFLDGRLTERIIPEKLEEIVDLSKPIIKEVPYKRVLLIGSGPIKIGQASEFDYSGTQALKSLKEIGVEVVLLNSNPATIMTDPEMAARTYIEPITKETIQKIIIKENVDAVLSTMGGQTALNMCIELEEEQFLSKNNCALLGAKVDTIKKTEDRDLFAKELDTLGYQTGKRYNAKSESEAREIAKDQVGFPLLIRRDFALGGHGSALVKDEAELEEVFKTDIKFPLTLEKSIYGWKEIELEVMVDKDKNGVIICSIENIDPCGIHTGDSITVAPAQTISDHCYQQLRTMSLTIAKHMGVVAGGANVQFAINPNDEDDIIVIEMNPRVSRSSALASKATGYPIAKISALLAVGYTLKEILNDITKASPVAFEPTLDYVALKIPIFPFNKFPTSSRRLGPQMRSVGEVLALGGSFNEAFLKALRSLESGLEIPSITQLKQTPIELTKEYLTDKLSVPQELSLLTVLDALRNGFSVEEIFNLTHITPWFIDQMNIIADAEKNIKEKNVLENKNGNEDFRELKAMGFSDKYLAKLLDKSQRDILKHRLDHKIFPVFKAVDTCSGEFNAETPYFYSTYNETYESTPLSESDRSVIVLGSGPNRIGQGIEFDYSCVKSCDRLKQKNIKAIMVNSNPETVSTDYDSSNRLYLTPLYSEDLVDILMFENPEGVIASFSGQTGIGIREHIEKSFYNEFFNFNFLGPSMKTLDLTEDRKLFSMEIEKTELSQTKSKEVAGYKHLVNAMIEIGFPVIIRPSYVIGGESMYIFHSHDDIHNLPEMHKKQLIENQGSFQIENYLENAIEYDVDLIRDKSGNCVFTVCEHIEYAGVHSGDSGMIAPPVAITSGLYQKLKSISTKLAEQLEIIGPINFQYAIKNGNVYCIEANPRGSRTLPFLSKAYNMSLPSLATDAMLSEDISSWDQEVSDFFCVKQSTFPFDRFIQDNIILGPKMRSTGETFGIDSDKDHAILKSYLGNYPNLLGQGKVLLSLSDLSKPMIIPYLKNFTQLGYKLYATGGTQRFIQKQGIPCELVNKINRPEQEGLNLVDLLKDDELKFVLNTPLDKGTSKSDGEYIRNTAIAHGKPCFTREENIKAILESLIGSQNKEMNPISLQDLHNIGMN
ncbi:MAG: carbamoyl-phosphate synthase large subunit [Bacteriovoracaceae bacterium]